MSLDLSSNEGHISTTGTLRHDNAQGGEMASQTVQGRRLVAQALPFIARHDVEGLVAMLTKDWTEADLISLLACPCPTSVKTATACLSASGSMAANAPVAQVLHHDDPVAARLAEHALWALWFRAGSKDANRNLRRAVRLMNDGQRAEALERFDDVVAGEPELAEGYNQRAICRYLEHQITESIADCDRALALNPYHFGAMAGRGHCLAQLKRYREALDSYRAALNIHPRLDGVRQSIRCLRRLAGVS